MSTSQASEVGAPTEPPTRLSDFQAQRPRRLAPKRRMKDADTLVLVLGYASRAAAQWVLIWGFATKEGAAGAGLLSATYALATPLFLFSEMGMRNVYQTMIPRPPLQTFVSARITLGLAAFTSLAIAALAGASGGIRVLVPVACIKLADSILDIFLGSLAARNQIRRVANAMLLNALATGLIAIATLAFTLTATPALWASAAVSLATLLAVATPEMRLARLQPPDVQGESRSIQIRRILRASLPLGTAQAANSLLIYIPVLYLTTAGQTHAAGVFAAAFSIVTLTSLLYSSIQQAWLSPLSNAFSSGGIPQLHQTWKRMAASIGASGLLAAVLIVLLGPLLLPSVFGADFGVTRRELVPLALAVLLLALFTTTSPILLVLNRYHRSLRTSLIALPIAATYAALNLSHASLVYACWMVAIIAAARAAISAVEVRGAVLLSRRLSQPTELNRESRTNAI